MPVNAKYLASFEENNLYHVYNRTNNKDALFLTDRHRRFFLKRFVEILSPLIYTHAWCLPDNRFHFLVRVKPLDIIQSHYLKLQKDKINLTSVETRFMRHEIDLNDLLEFTFKRFFQSYAMAFNKDVNRVGSLFVKKFRRIKVDMEAHLMQTIIYIHANAVKHRLTKDFTQYKWSSWASYLDGSDDTVSKDFILDFFGTKDEFIQMHLLHAQKYFDYK